jgi:hypothetical protein
MRSQINLQGGEAKVRNPRSVRSESAETWGEGGEMGAGLRLRDLEESGGLYCTDPSICLGDDEVGAGR